MMNQINCKYFILPVMQCKKYFSLEEEMMLLPVIQARQLLIKKLYIICENAADMTANAIIMTQSHIRTVKRNHTRAELGG